MATNVAKTTLAPVRQTVAVKPAAAATGSQPGSNGMKEKMGDAINKGTEKMKELYSKQGPLIIFLLVVLLIFVVVIIYITFALKNSNLKGKTLTSKPIKLNELAVPFEVSSAEIPKPAVGREYSFSLWVYVESYEQTPDHKMVFVRTSNRGDISTANPLVMMDKKDNRMYIVIKTQDSSLPAPTNGISRLSDVIDNNYFNKLNPVPTDNKHIIMEIDYIPLQRWVNVMFVVDNKIITLFMDGEIYSVKSTDELKALKKPEIDPITGKPKKENLIIDKTDGDILIGKNPVNDRHTVNGYLSNLMFLNYAMSLSQVKSTYNAGPLSKGGLLSSMGLQYGVRSPVYKLNEGKQA